MWREFLRIVAAGDRAAADDNVAEATQDVAMALALYQSSSAFPPWIHRAPVALLRCLLLLLTLPRAAPVQARGRGPRCRT